MKATATKTAAKTRHYAPAALGNGGLSILIGPEGDQKNQEYSGMIPGIRRAGYRYDCRKGGLIPFGSFRFGGKGNAADWTQSLDPANGILETEAVFPDGSAIRSETFCHFDRNILAVHIRRSGNGSGNGNEVFRFEYELTAPRMSRKASGDGRIAYSIDVMNMENPVFDPSGTIRMRADVPARFIPERDGLYILETEAAEFTVFLSFDEPEFQPDFESLKRETVEKWSAYHAESMLRVPSEKIQKLYDMCQYHLKISSTKWSVPTGIYDTHWHGLYFGFDEYFMFMAFATSGHLSTAAKIPHFRWNLLPGLASGRLNSRANNTGAARYAWESDEAGFECSPAGFWHEHVFQAGHYALTAWEMFRFSGDETLLRNELYPVMRAMMEWIRVFKIVRGEDGSANVAVCTDLERLGPGRPNPFMTSCSLIAMFEAGTEAAARLGVDTDKIPLWKQIAVDLRKNLPNANGRYIPYPGCETRSIGALAGLYPYGVLSKDDPLQRAALEDYIRERFTCGNMYDLGHGVCSWYACWEALACARSGDGERALACLEKLAEETGCFSEMFEIYEAGMRPWFTTAEGIFIQAVNELLLRFGNDGTGIIAPARPEAWKDFAFRLQDRGGKKLEVEFRGGKCVRKEQTGISKN